MIKTVPVRSGRLSRIDLRIQREESERNQTTMAFLKSNGGAIVDQTGELVHDVQDLNEPVAVSDVFSRSIDLSAPGER